MTLHGKLVPFELDPLRRQALLLGLDDIGQTSLVHDRILPWQAQDRADRSWIWGLANPVL